MLFTLQSVIRILFLLVASTAALSKDRPGPASPALMAGAEARAHAAIDQFSQSLRSALQKQLQLGPLAAMEVCQTQAPLIAEEVMQAHGLRLGRTSTRVRNLANAPANWQATILDAFADHVARGALPAAQQAMLREDLPDGIALRLMRGIAMAEHCTLCHGREIAPDIAAWLRTHSPHDTATGYRAGELRGAFWVEVPQPVAP